MAAQKAGCPAGPDASGAHQTLTTVNHWNLKVYPFSPLSFQEVSLQPSQQPRSGFVERGQHHVSQCVVSYRGVDLKVNRESMYA